MDGNCPRYHSPLARNVRTCRGTLTFFKGLSSARAIQPGAWIDGAMCRGREFGDAFCAALAEHDRKAVGEMKFLWVWALSAFFSIAL